MHNQLMTKIFTLRSTFFWAVVGVCLLPFVVLAFFETMALDDYYFYFLYRARGFWDAQHYLYLHWAGRYTSSFITGSFVALDVPGRWPFLPTLVYFVATWGAIVYLLRGARLLLPVGFFGRQGLGKASAVGFVLFLYVQTDIATGFYWLSSTSVYQTGFIVFLLLVGTILRLGSSGPVRGRWLFFLLIVLLMGCNEIMAVFLPLFLAGLAGLSYFYRRHVDRWLWLGLGVAVGVGLVIFFTSGVMNYRQQLMNGHTGLLAIVPIVGFRTVEVFFYVFKEPLFWGCGVACFVFGVAVSPSLKEGGPLAFFRGQHVVVPAAAVLTAVVLLSLAAFLLASRGSIPARALNNLSDLAAFCLLGVCFLGGIYRGARSTAPVLPKASPGVQAVVFIVLLLASVNYAEAWKSVGSGYFYHAVMADRDGVLKAEAAAHARIGIVVPYDAALSGKIDLVFPHGAFATARAWLLQKPTMLVFYDGAAVGDAAYAHFYGLESVIVRDK